MRMVRNVVMALAVLASAAAANANSVAYFSTGAPVAPAGGGPGGPGTRLDLTCDTTAAGSCSWVITFAVNTTGNTLAGWSMDLSTAPGNGVSVSNPATAAGSPYTSGASAGVPGTGAALLVGAAGQSFSPPAPPASVNLLTFTLTRAIQVGDLTAADIFFKTNANDSIVWTNGDLGDYETITVGPNAPVVGAENTSLPLAVIRIQNVPEPTSLGLLALGGLAILRRRVGR